MAIKISTTSEGWAFRCPGCEEVHTLSSAIWKYNGDPESPTFRESVLVKSGHYAGFGDSDACWCTYNAKQKSQGLPEAPFRCRLCHSYVTDGKIQFLSDSTHSLSGQTVNLPNWRDPD